VGIDGSTTSWRALSMAAGIAARYDAEAHACYVSHVPLPVDMTAFALPVTPFLDDDDGSDLAREVVKEIEGSAARVDFRCRKGDIAQELEALAESFQADVIVVGRSSHPALHLGGVPRKLLAMGHRPVLVVP